MVAVEQSACPDRAAAAVAGGVALVRYLEVTERLEKPPDRVNQLEE